MKKDTERIGRIQQALKEASLNAMICTLPTNILLLSGYWPVVGASIGIAAEDGRIVLIVPEDERELAQSGWADEVMTYSAGSLEEIRTVAEAVRPPLVEQITRLRLFTGGKLGYESEPEFQPSPYAAVCLLGANAHRFFSEVFYQAKFFPVNELLLKLRSRLTGKELTRLRIACNLAERGFQRGARRLREGLKETAAANLFRSPLTLLTKKVQRADGFTYCMSGPNSFEAFAAYQRSRSRKIESGDLVLIHCNSYADGFWTDLTRTFCIGEPNDQQHRMFAAVFAARAAALAMVKPGVQGSVVDRAARDKIKEHGFERDFRHPTGHGVGFAAINHNAPPRLHPHSTDVLEAGMVFNLEPGIYIEGFGGMRHCDMVAVTENGSEVVTPFQGTQEELILTRGHLKEA